MATAHDIIRKAMQKAGILTKTEVPSADEANDALDSLNMMLDSWSNDSMFIFARTWETFDITGGVSEYTIGPSADFDTARPIFIVDSYVRQTITDYPVEIVTDEIYNTSIWDKSSQGIPRFLNYDNNNPISKIRLWPVPAQAYRLFILSEKQLSSFTMYGEINLPAGWERALVYSLAVELSPEYGSEVSQATIFIAEQALKNIKRTINKNRTMDATPMRGFGWNIYSGR